MCLCLSLGDVAVDGGSVSLKMAVDCELGEEAASKKSWSQSQGIKTIESLKTTHYLYYVPFLGGFLGFLILFHAYYLHAMCSVGSPHGLYAADELESGQ